jgi:hypothetical protein
MRVGRYIAGGVTVQWTQTYAGATKPFLDDVVGTLLAAYKNPDRVRLVFWFN